MWVFFEYLGTQNDAQVSTLFLKIVEKLVLHPVLLFESQEYTSSEITLEILSMKITLM